ncbi:MAG TPA: MarR family winged helix-turn-helix transcriptional regulator [Candidatus Dormibacteraeota bacterium]|nr:MarR family winged helix-turn-helix transcriptional regulator [Candidatus Dormibacteraeota bacterium]
MGPNNDLGYLLQHLASLLGHQTDQVLQEQLGIGLSQFKILWILQWNPNVDQRYIAESLGQTEASISRQIRLLKTEGLLGSQRDADNRRRHITAATLKGTKVTEAAVEIMRRSFAPMLDQLSDKQFEQLMESLQILHKAVCKNETSSRYRHIASL